VTCPAALPTPPTSAGPRPSPRYAFGFAYDVGHHEAVLFGRVAPAGNAFDTWTWDGTTWTQLHPARSPGGDLVLAYDARRQQVVGFGGVSTWTWDGTVWSQAHPAHNPPSRGQEALVWDSKRERVLMIGGIAGANSFRSDVWAWDGRDWQRLAGDQYSDQNTAAYFPNDDTVVVYPAPGRPTQMTIFDGSSWSQRPAGTTELPQDGVISYDEALGTLVMFGEHPNPPDGYTGRTPATWTWDGNLWRQVDFGGGPLCMTGGYQVVYDSARQRLVLFGGDREVQFHGAFEMTNELWEFDGRRWTQIQ